MSRPERRRPGAQSPLLIPQVEPVRTSPAKPFVVPEQANQPDSVTEQITKSASSRPVMIDRTFKIEEELVRRGETAVLRRAGGYTSMKAFVNGAFAAELARLEEAHNGGEPFPPNDSGFQRGRPFGS